MNSSERPVTSKPRGICRYYNTPRGCYQGDNCKFLHGETEKHTPYDLSKTCRFYAQGHCRRGAACWFKHVDPVTSETAADSTPQTEEELFCCICYEKPVTYGLLEGCSHIFCLGCIRQWRLNQGKPEETVASGVTKQCPLCRAPSRFITPSSYFYPAEHPKKAEIIEKYKASMARVPCKHFESSPPNDRFCPFGKDCFYQHRNADGTAYVFARGIEHNMRVSRRRRNRETLDLRRLILDYDIEDVIAGLSDFAEAHYGDWVQDVATDTESDTDTGTPHGHFVIDEHTRMEDMMARLAILLDARTVDEPDFPSPLDHLASPVDTDETLVNTTGAEPTATESAAQSTIVSRSQSPVLAPGPRSVTPRIPAPEPAVERPSFVSVRAASETIPRSRFSTVVDRTSRSTPYEQNAVLDDTRPLPASAGDIAPPASAEAAPMQPDRVHSDEQFSRETEVILNETRDLHRRAEDVMRSLEASELPSSPSPPAVDVPREEVGPTSSDTPPETVHDIEPPFLTDGRGRVVWSNAATARHRESRRARASTTTGPAQQKVRRDAPDMETANARSAAEDATGDAVVTRQSSRPRATRAQTSGAIVEGGSWVPVDGA